VPLTTLILILVNFVAYLVHVSALYEDPAQLHPYTFVPWEFWNGDNLLGFFTSIFMHWGPAHLIFNMYFLWLFSALEERIQPVVFLLLYLLGGLVANLVHGALTSHSFSMVAGASGAISTVMGASLFLIPRKKFYQVILFIQFRMSIWLYLLVWLGIQFWMAKRGAQFIAVYAHIGGFFFGALAGLLLRKSWKNRELPQIYPPHHR
jgi:membrane associated rhomboid family serine protease